MKKIITTILLCLILCCCMSVNDADLGKDIDAFLSNINASYKSSINNTTTYYSYYLPSDMHEIDGTANAAYMEFEESQIIMNLNIAGIINDEYYLSNPITNEGFFIDDNLFYEASGYFTKYDDTTSHYYLDIYQDQSNYLVYLVCSDIHFYAVSNKYELVSLLNHLFIIARSIEIDKNAIIKDYSTKDVIDYKKKSIDLFDYVIPSSGYLSEMVNSVEGKIINQSDAAALQEQNNSNEE